MVVGLVIFGSSMIARITDPMIKVTVVVALTSLLLLIAAGSFEHRRNGDGPLGRQPRLEQSRHIIILTNFVGYWLYCAFHSGRLWSYHAIHHSSANLDWLAAARVYPVNDIVNKAAPTVILVALGDAPILLGGALSFVTAYAILQHANVSWDLGPVRCFLASPRFHLWHPTSVAEGRDKNVAGLPLLWDILFRTYYMPAMQPTQFGVVDLIPYDLVGQLFWPFWRIR